MEKKLKALFDYQRFEKNERLGKIIKETESRYERELSDDDLSLVNAAGVTDENTGGIHIPNKTQVGGLFGGLSGESDKESFVSGYITGGLTGYLIDDAGGLIGTGGGGGGQGSGGKGTAM